MEQSLIILKPDCIQANLTGTVLARFEQEGFRMAACKMTTLTDAILAEHYAHLADKPFFPEIAAFMRSSPVVILILQGENAINRIRDLLGPTDSTIAPKGTIRGDLGTDRMQNIAHASDGVDAAKAEIARFFGKDEIFN
jgi:nucleoside-diphosphate kinase